MKQTNSDLIGKVLAVDEMQISRANDALKKVLPSVQAIIDECNALESLPAFSQKTWDKILNDGGKSIEKKYLSQAEQDLKDMKNAAIRSSAMEGVSKALGPLKSAIAAAQKACENARYSIIGSVDITLNDVRIEKGSPVIDLERVTENYTIRIENESQAELYRAGIEAEKAMEKLRLLLEGTNSDPNRIGWGCNPGAQGAFTFDISTARVEFDVTCVQDAREAEPELIA